MKLTSGSDLNVSNGGAAATFPFMVCVLKDFKAWRFRNHFAAAKWVYRAAKWHSYAKGWFRSCETPFKMAVRLQNGGVQGVEASQLRNGCTSLRNGTRVLRDLFAAAKIFTEGAWRLRNHFAARIDFRSGSLLAAKFHRPCFFLAFWAPLDSQLPSFNFFDIPLDFDHPKTYITSKQIRIKALKSKLKHWNQNLKHWNQN